MKGTLKFFSLFLILTMLFSISAMASENNYEINDLIGAEQSEFEQLINEIQAIKAEQPEYTENMVQDILDEHHGESERGIADIWNVLTDSEKKLCIRYPLDALKVNTAKNIATSKTEAKFGFNGLGYRPDGTGHRPDRYHDTPVPACTGEIPHAGNK
ncbi:MAG: hypothetical protein K2G55_04355 [Lachnospiraceae bacterium]|nr:hypothetical protein [Lachnospiraceae bacterium]